MSRPPGMREMPRRRFPLSLAHLSTPDLHALQERLVREHHMLPAAVLKWHDFWPGEAWFQPFPGDWVAVDIKRARSRKAPRWSVSIWGMDDIGAIAVVRALPKPITWTQIRSTGFEQWRKRSTRSALPPQVSPMRSRPSASACPASRRSRSQQAASPQP